MALISIIVEQDPVSQRYALVAWREEQGQTKGKCLEVKHTYFDGRVPRIRKRMLRRHVANEKARLEALRTESQHVTLEDADGPQA